MATWAERLYTHLLAHAPLTALVTDRIYHHEIRADQPRPYVVYEQLSADYIHHQAQGSGLAGFEVQITAVGQSDDQARQVSEVLRKYLADTHVVFGTIGTVPDVLIHLHEETEQFTVPIDAGEEGFPAVVQTYTIWYTVSVTG